MDAAELKVICDNYEASLDLLRGKLGIAEDELFGARLDAACLRHGGHKFVERGPNGAKYKECEYCGTRP